MSQGIVDGTVNVAGQYMRSSSCHLVVYGILHHACSTGTVMNDGQSSFVGIITMHSDQKLTGLKAISLASVAGVA
jgi:hypothetical protein